MNGGRLATAIAAAPLPLLMILLTTPLGHTTLTSDRIHIAFIAAAVVVPLALGILALNAFLTHGQVRELALAAGFFGFTAIYTWHGVFTGTEPAFRWLIYGAPSRIAFAACLLAVPSIRTVAQPRRAKWVIAIVLAAGGLAYGSWAGATALGAWATIQTPATLNAVRIGLESTAAVLAAAATLRLFLARRSGIPPIVIGGAAIVVHQSLFFALATPWDLVWWSAHGLGAFGSTVLAVGVLVVVQRAHREAQLTWVRREAEVRQLFLNNAAHALRTPLTPLTLQLHLLRGQLAGTPSAATVEKAEKATRRLTAIVDELLLAAEAGAPAAIEAKATDLNLAALANDVAGEAETAANAKGLQIIVDAKPARALASESKIRKVLQNLLDNAIRYTPSGHIVVTVRSTTDGASVSVRDTGIGIAPEDLSLIFTPFGTLGRPEQQRTSGAGLSLAVCQVIIANHGGTMTAHSDGLGRGTTITFELPRALAR